MSMHASVQRPPASRTGEQSVWPRGVQGWYRRYPVDSKAKLLGLYLVSFLLISTVYVTYTSRVWSYMGLDLSVSVIKIIVSFFVLSIFVYITPVKWSARTFFLNIVLTAYLLPSLVLFGLSNKPVPAAIIIWASVAIVYGVSAIPFRAFKIFALSSKMAMWFLLTLSLLFISVFIFVGGFNHLNFDFSKVYSIREETAESMPDAFVYLSTTFSNAIIPFGIAISMYYRSYVNTALFAAVSVIMFGLTGHKIMLFTPFFVIATFLFLSHKLRYSTVLYGFVGLVAIVTASVIVYDYFSVQSFWGWLESLFIQRILLVPAMLDYAYIEFFSHNAQYHWSTSRITFGMVAAPHGGFSPPEMVGMAHFGSARYWADTGFIGSGFAQAGVVGSVVYAIATGAVIGVFQSYSRHMGVPLIASATLGLFTTMIQSSDFVSLFLTHGLFLALIILASVRNDHVAPEGGRPARGPSGFRRADLRRRALEQAPAAGRSGRGEPGG